MIKKWLLKLLRAEIEAIADQAASAKLAEYIDSQKRGGPVGWKPLSKKAS